MFILYSQNVHFIITKCSFFAAKVVFFFDIRKQNHKKPTNIFNFHKFLGRMWLKEDNLVSNFAIATLALLFINK